MSPSDINNLNVLVFIKYNLLKTMTSAVCSSAFDLQADETSVERRSGRPTLTTPISTVHVTASRVKDNRIQASERLVRRQLL